MTEESVAAETVQGADVSAAGEGAGTPEVTVEATTDTTIPIGQEVLEGMSVEGEGQPYDSPPAEVRIQELANRTRELEGKLSQIVDQKRQEQPEFVEIDNEKVNSFIAQKMEQIRDLELDGKAREAFALQKELDKLWTNLEENETRKQAWLANQQAQQQQQQQQAAIEERINIASELVRQQSNITPEVWQRGADWFYAERAKNPLLQARYVERIEKSGVTEALIWAADYVKQHMGTQISAVTQAKEEAKANIPGGKSGTGQSEPADRQAVRLRNMYPTMYK